MPRSISIQIPARSVVAVAELSSVVIVNETEIHDNVQVGIYRESQISVSAVEFGAPLIAHESMTNRFVYPLTLSMRSLA